MTQETQLIERARQYLKRTKPLPNIGFALEVAEGIISELLSRCEALQQERDRVVELHRTLMKQADERCEALEVDNAALQSQVQALTLDAERFRSIEKNFIYIRHDGADKWDVQYKWIGVGPDDCWRYSDSLREAVDSVVKELDAARSAEKGE